MRLFSKVFFSIMTILCLSLALFGYLQISSVLRDNFNRETERVADAYRMLRYVLQTSTDSRPGDGRPDTEQLQRILDEVPHTGLVSVFDENGEVLLNEYPGDVKVFALESLDNTGVNCGVEYLGESTYVTASGFLYLSNTRMFLGVSNDVTAIAEQTDAQIGRYRVVYLIVCGIALIGVSFVTGRIVAPIRKTAQGASRIAMGQYHVRVDSPSDDELGDLARSFNRMASAVEESVDALQASANEKEEFVDNFAHELKTPLTSVIGYADMLTQKNLSEKEVRTYAQYILDEGLRLEALSYKLMELIVLNKQDFVLEELHTKELFEHVAEGFKPLFAERKIRARLEIEETYLRVEYDLFKTMLLNLIDNAAKADATQITIRGEIGEATQETKGKACYIISIEDNGRGMPKEALERITEAFYMVDKSRSRAQHGAGLGLALVKRIVELHHATLSFESEEHAGTTVRVCMPLDEAQPVKDESLYEEEIVS